MNRRRLLAVLGVLLSTGALAIAVAPSASAHPLGNFTRNTYVGFIVSPGHVAVDAVLDLAEVPTYQERGVMDTDGDGSVSSSEASTWAASRCEATSGEISARTNVGAMQWTVGRSVVTFPAGQGGLPLTRLECALSADAVGATTLDATVAVEQGRVGWHEVTAVGHGVTLSADVPATSASNRLTAYPLDVPPADVSSVHLTWATEAAQPVRAEGPVDGSVRAPVDTVADTTAPAATSSVTSIAPFGLDSAAQSFTDLVSRQDVTLGFGLVALAIALALGGLHALAPGHGKTLMAASLVGTKGRRREAIVLGASVTTAHTAGVVVLAVVLSVSSSIAAESAYPWLGLASAALAVGVGISLLRQARRGGGLGHHHGGHEHPHDHPHDHTHDHDPHPHEGHGHDHPHDHPHPHPHGHGHGAVDVATPVTTTATTAVDTRPTTRRVITLGLAGGMVPSPSAVVVLLAGFALGRAWFALLLVVAYGLGMAVTLCLTGLLLVRAGHLARRVTSAGSMPRAVQFALLRLPLAAAVTVVVAGVLIGVRSIMSM